MHSNSDNLRSLPTHKKKKTKKPHFHTYTHTKQRGFSPSQLTLWLIKWWASGCSCLLHEQHGGRWQKSENQYYNGGGFCIKEESKWFSSCKMGTYVRPKGIHIILRLFP